MTRKKIIFFVQGEGHGHITQAISMYELLISKGHEVCAVVLGSSSTRTTPDFLFRKIKSPIVKVKSPNFVFDKKNKSVKIIPSIIHNLFQINAFRNSLRITHLLLKLHKPDVVLNFFEPPIGIYYFFRNPRFPMICIGHQYIYLHRDFRFPRGFLVNQLAIRFYTRITATRAAKKLALSFYPLPEVSSSQNLVIVPPLLRDEVFGLKPETKDFYLIYLVNSGYMEDIINWHRRHPDTELHCFTDTFDKDVQYHSDTFFLHPISDSEFLEKMAETRGLITSAGFESVCEAMYLGKPVLMVPIEGHFEQYCNALDAFKSGAGIYNEKFDISRLLEYASVYTYNNYGFKEWVNESGESIYKEIRMCLNRYDTVQEPVIGSLKNAAG